eukprot:TRINITY_DN9300_c0_g1_i1.p3 TRINITY_DN9300_c0_g1~~TRINITY_DN9300_c0_g1_i1.p3  ORF type:complete len:62 (+),score=9.82 TRINITY_DN9300_c0_g1_i1:116-301(+)
MFPPGALQNKNGTLHQGNDAAPPRASKVSWAAAALRKRFEAPGKALQKRCEGQKGRSSLAP